MKMKRALLIQAIDDALKAHEDDKARYVREVKEWHERRSERWFDSSLPRWKALRDLITEKVRHGQAITEDEVKKALGAEWFGHVCWSPKAEPNSNQVKRVRVVDTAALASLRRMLEVITDDEVSTAQLERLGFRGLHSVFRAAAGV
ncbi:Uncharacterised protein [Mycobacteroides abscessus subsp. bolletii]|uniref:hypothetical protein n=1 Tax=Mycobacteroides abscessus TaxID=36809 RepID=UPI0009CEE615|nr:hypothetical protein [Mycobacteroides abscessus]SKR94501.1 Uncharacterised protein [Mycobacteroides abscessus subsp. bolletii]SKS03048.1 Uncharacterised protein [Mycobacteroides abscessus subsp. bolletii]DAZ90121.1 TPA_asm: hypothetical protein PROPHIFVLQ01-1_34 [Mycobacterium phage prophiFVLQ01-1]